MKKITISAIAVCASLAAGPAFAYSCPNDISAIEDAMENASLSDSKMDKVEALLEKGDDLHSQGKHAASVKALGEAKAILGI